MLFTEARFAVATGGAGGMDRGLRGTGSVGRNGVRSMNLGRYKRAFSMV